LSNTNSTGAVVAAVVISLAVGGVGGYMFGQRSGQNAAKLEAKVVATVNDEKITQLDLYERMIRQGGGSLLDQMIDEKLVEQAAKRENITVSPSEIDAEIAKLKERFGGDEGLNSAMQQAGITMDQLKENIAFQKKLFKLLAKGENPDDATLKKYFEENIAQFDKRQVHARHILVKTEEEAKAIKAELDKGADFAKLAKEKSTEPAAKETGGDLGTFGRGKMVAEFENVVFNLKPNEISQPFQSSFGWHVAQVLEIKGDAPTFEALKNDVKEAYLQEKANQKKDEWLAKEKEKAKITNTLQTK
jgi:foldase protein PrsA